MNHTGMRTVLENVSNALRSLASSWLRDEDEQMIRLAQARCCIGPVERIARAGSCLSGIGCSRACKRLRAGLKKQGDMPINVCITARASHRSTSRMHAKRWRVPGKSQAIRSSCRNTKRKRFDFQRRWKTPMIENGGSMIWQRSEYECIHVTSIQTAGVRE